MRTNTSNIPMRVNLYSGFSALIHPSICIACSQKAVKQDEVICLDCDYHLPRANFHTEKENKFTERFWGRVPIETAASMYLFNGNEHIKRLIHALKYDGKTKIGEQIGRMLGKRIGYANPIFQNIDLILPVPLHYKKQLERGYNQSDSFAKGLAATLWTEHKTDVLKRKVYTKSQTTMSAMERMKNVENIFEVIEPELLKNKNILLVDDVVTTGATLEACAKEILKIEGTKVSFATMAFAV